MRKIDAFAHILPRAYLARLERQLEQTMDPHQLAYYREGVFSFDPVLTDLDARWRTMDQLAQLAPAGAYQQVLVLAVPPLEEAGPPDVAAEGPPAPAGAGPPGGGVGAPLPRRPGEGARRSAGPGQPAAAAARLFPAVLCGYGAVRRAPRGALRARVLRPAARAVRHRHAAGTRQRGRSDHRGPRGGRAVQRGPGGGLCRKRRAPTRAAGRLTEISRRKPQGFTPGG